MADLKKMSDSELYDWIAEWKPSDSRHIAGQEELARRRSEPSNRLSRIAIYIAAGSFIVAVVALAYAILPSGGV